MFLFGQSIATVF